MPLPSLRTPHGAQAANALEYAKRAILTAAPERAAAEVGVPLETVQSHPVVQRLEGAMSPAEQAMLAETYQTDPATARAALESREGRAAWLAGVMLGHVKFEGAFGSRKAFPPAVRIQASRLLGLMHGDFVQRHQVEVTERAVYVFSVPDNGRLPAEHVVEAPPESQL